MLNPLYTAVSWVLLRWHDLLSTFMDPASGVTWALSIALLVVTIRILLFRFFIKQVHSQRKMQEVQPKIAALRDKYKNDRQTLSQEMLKLQREEGFNPLGGCLPILLQAPVFLSLFHVLRLVGSSKAPALYNEYGWSQDQAVSAGKATLFGAPIASAFSDPRNLATSLDGASPTATKVVAFLLIVLMVAATYITQRQIMARSGAVLDGQQAMIQKLLLYGMPASLFVSGFFFPIGVLLYWFTNNLWTMGQQFYILKRMPHPNAKQAEKPSVDPKLLAPRPGQKPAVNPKRRAATPPKTAAPRPGDAAGPAADAAAGGDGDAAATDGKAANGKAAKAAKAAKAPAKAPKAAKDTPAEDRPAPDGAPAAPDGVAAATDAVDGTPPVPPTPTIGPGGAPRPGRRPPGQRSSTTTRPKKKRR